jgi:hypothetical protein
MQTRRRLIGAGKVAFEDEPLDRLSLSISLLPLEIMEPNALCLLKLPPCYQKAVKFEIRKILYFTSENPNSF